MEKIKIEIVKGIKPPKTYYVSLLDDSDVRCIALKKLEQNWHKILPDIRIGDDLYQMNQEEAQIFLDNNPRKRMYKMIQQIGDKVDDSTLAMIHLFPELEDLTIIGNNVTDDGVKTLVGLNVLKSFCLYSPLVTNSSADAIMAFKKLELLDLQGSSNISCDVALKIRNSLVKIKEYWPPNYKHA